MSFTKSFDIRGEVVETLRHMRGAVSNKLITPDQMQEHGTELLDKFAKALFALEKPEFLHQDDTLKDAKSHLDSLNEYILQLNQTVLTDSQRLTTHDRYVGTLDEEIFEVVFALIESGLAEKKYLVNEADHFSLLSTGAMIFALIAYVYQISVTLVAVNKEKTVVYMQEGFKPTREIALIYDDLEGEQAHRVAAAVKRAMLGNGIRNPQIVIEQF